MLTTNQNMIVSAAFLMLITRKLHAIGHRWGAPLLKATCDLSESTILVSSVKFKDSSLKVCWECIEHLCSTQTSIWTLAYNPVRFWLFVGLICSLLTGFLCPSNNPTFLITFWLKYWHQFSNQWEELEQNMYVCETTTGRTWTLNTR